MKKVQLKRSKLYSDQGMITRYYNPTESYLDQWEVRKQEGRLPYYLVIYPENMIETMKKKGNFVPYYSSTVCFKLKEAIKHIEECEKYGMIKRKFLEWGE